ncbi:programmed cell death protein 5 [Folsomia candida]|uniref:programmed cell death protein 5 n=1 Tax=Folsomia candida TaxID=158441 RepID=UPI000B8FCA1E|nr:programmed cell death protein 5 [Folsomia candida]
MTTPGNPPGHAPNAAAAAQEKEDQQQQQQEMKNQILSQVLDQPARARLNTLMLAKPSKAAAVENLLIQMARMGQLRGKIGEDELIGLLEKVSGGSGEKMRVNFDRRRTRVDSDSDEFDDL